MLIDLCREIDLDSAAARDVLTQRTFLAAVDDDWERSRQNNIRAVPTFVMGSQRLVGHQPFAALERLVQTAGVRRRA
jgi:predicted DsbA family dithiol-disulfide isomerase